MFRKVPFSLAQYLRFQQSAFGGVFKTYGIKSAQNLFIPQYHQRSLRTSTNSSSWRTQTATCQDRCRKAIPNFAIVRKPWTYLVTKYHLWKLHLLDPEFNEKDFISGSKQAAVVLTDIIRNRNTDEIGKYTTPLGCCQIKRDMLTDNDSRLKLMKFETEHLRHAIPIKVTVPSKFDKQNGHADWSIDMLFVGARNIRDFDTPEEVVEIEEVLRQLEACKNAPPDAVNAPHRVIFAEILMSLRRNCSERNEISSLHCGSENENVKPDWTVSFYKVIHFDIISYYPLN